MPAPTLLQAAEQVLAPWLERSMLDRLAPLGSDDELVADATRQRVAATAQLTATRIMTDLRELLSSDVEEQRTSPLDLVRSHLGPATELLVELGAPAPTIDEFERRSFPGDVFRLGPATWADIDPSLQEPGMVWGAWKAFTVMSRHRATES